MHGTFFRDFPGFPRFPDLVGTLFLGPKKKKKSIDQITLILTYLDPYFYKS